MNNSNSIFQSEPAPVKDFVRRERLDFLGRRILEFQVATVVAPAGFGKTVWVSSLPDMPGWPSTVWVGLDRRDTEPSILLYHLIRSINKVYKCTEAWRTLMSLQSCENEWPIAAAAFIEDIPLDNQLILILDDLHFLYDSPVSLVIIEYIIDRLPGNAHIILVARSAPPFKLYKHEIKSQLLRIDGDELLFREDEARALFSNMKLELSDSDAAALFARTEGWAAGLRLLGIYLQQPGSNIQEAFQSLHQEDSSFYLYIMNEFLAAMPQYINEFLLSASLLPYLEVKLCNASFARTDSEKILRDLQGYGLLLPSKNKGIWRMHNLIEDWLKDIAVKQLCQNSIAMLRERAAAYFVQTGDIDRAIEQAILSERWDIAAQIIHEYGNEYLSQIIHMDSLFKWIEKLPENLVENDCWLQYFKGMSLLNVDDSRAFGILYKASDMAADAGDIKCEAGAIWSMMLPAIFSGDVEKGETAGRRLLQNSELFTNPESRKEALAAALLYAMARDSLMESIELSRQALRLDMPPEMAMWVRYNAGYMLLRIGRLQEARAIIEETLAMPYVLENERRLIVGYEALSDITFIMGDFAALDTACQSCFELGKKYGMLGIAGRAYYLKAHSHYREGRYPEAGRDFNAAYEYFTSAGIVHFANQTAIDIMLLRIRNGEDAKALLGRLLELKSEFDNIPYGLGIDYMVNTLSGIAAMEAGDLGLSRQLFEKSARHWQDIGAKISLAETWFLLSYVLLLQGDEDASDGMLRKALCESESYGWLNFWGWHHESIYTVCWRSIYKNIHPKWAVRILKRWFPEQSLHEFSRLLTLSNDLRVLAADYFGDRSKETGRKILSVFYLGGFRLFINGSQINESCWKTKKAESLFKYIIADRRLSNKEVLMHLLWPEGDQESNDGKLRMTLSYVRKALASAGLPPETIVMHKGSVIIGTGLEVHCDYEDFKQKAYSALNYLKSNSPFAIPALEQAARLYTGEFLPEDIYDDNTASMRNSLHNLYLEVLSGMAKARFTCGNLPAALQACYDYLAQEPADETIIRMAMSILAKEDKKHKALELYNDLKDVLAREFSAAPEKETTALYRKIQSGDE